MKLYRAAYEYMNEDSDIIFVKASNEQQAMNYVRDKHGDIFKDILLEMSLEEYLVEVSRFEGEAHYLLGRKDYKQIGRLYFDHYFKHDWEIEEVEVDPDKEIWVAVPEQVSSPEDAFIIPTSHNSTMDEVKERFSTVLSQDENFREYIEDKSVDMGLLAKMHHDEFGWIFANDPPFRLRKDLDVQAKLQNMCGWEYSDKIMFQQIDSYFGEDLGMKEEYLDYLRNDTRPSEQFYQYLARKHIENRDWDNYTLKRVDIA